jgi:hypothetical protein
MSSLPERAFTMISWARFDGVQRLSTAYLRHAADGRAHLLRYRQSARN